MNHNEQEIEKKLHKFSVIKVCPKCRQLSLAYSRNSIYCSNCGFKEEMTKVGG
ncbi:hypothetical protein HYW99_00165 [Candidatus Woesearchaeota archaeon]|nr:hypothetical protein [Candidatus Woesearchaeota archaeon]